MTACPEGKGGHKKPKRRLSEIKVIKGRELKAAFYEIVIVRSDDNFFFSDNTTRLER